MALIYCWGKKKLDIKKYILFDTIYDLFLKAILTDYCRSQDSKCFCGDGHSGG